MEKIFQIHLFRDELIFEITLAHFDLKLYSVFVYDFFFNKIFLSLLFSHDDKNCVIFCKNILLR